jgi:hypothetical protein
MPSNDSGRLAEIPGWRIWMIEYQREPGSHYVTDYLHIPDELTILRDRQTWIRSTGIVPDGARLTWAGPHVCQEHMFDCSMTVHTPDTNQLIATWEASVLRVTDDREPRSPGLSELIASTLDSLEPAPIDNIYPDQDRCDNPDCRCNEPISSIEHEDN